MILYFKLDGYIRIHKFHETGFHLIKLLVDISVHMKELQRQRCSQLSSTLLDKGNHNALQGSRSCEVWG